VPAPPMQRKAACPIRLLQQPAQAQRAASPHSATSQAVSLQLLLHSPQMIAKRTHPLLHPIRTRAPCGTCSLRSASPAAPRLLFLTPEKVARSDAIMRLLDRLHAEGRFARAVVDEAHCARNPS
jgi:superfamily II DNA helicase RecQ